jgi:hypothetical protein
VVIAADEGNTPEVCLDEGLETAAGAAKACGWMHYHSTTGHRFAAHGRRRDRMMVDGERRSPLMDNGR